MGSGHSSLSAPGCFGAGWDHTWVSTGHQMCCLCPTGLAVLVGSISSVFLPLCPLCRFPLSHTPALLSPCPLAHLGPFGHFGPSPHTGVC